jgi:hypothetical protein
MPFSLHPDVGDIAAPDVIGRWNIELSIQNVRNVWPLHRRFFIRMRARLPADQSQFPNQAAYLKSADLLAIFLHHQNDAATAGSASTLREQFVDSSA